MVAWTRGPVRQRRPLRDEGASSDGMSPSRVSHPVA